MAERRAVVFMIMVIALMVVNGYFHLRFSCLHNNGVIATGQKAL
jgi:hypothetical protein